MFSKAMECSTSKISFSNFSKNRPFFKKMTFYDQKTRNCNELETFAPQEKLSFSS